MDLEIKHECDGVDWRAVSETLKLVGMAYHDPEVHRRAFEASYAAVFIYHGDRLIGFGRAISDGEYQAAVYDCAVHPEFQGQGLGRMLMEHLLPRIAHCNIMLFATPGKEGFYQKLGFRIMKTGMARFINSEVMQERGFTE